MQPSYYNSIWVTGCAPGGTGEVRLVERDNESNVIARATIVVVQYTVPSHIRNLRQTEEGDGSLTVTWDAPRRTGGSDIVGYAVEYRLDGAAWASESPPVRDTSGPGTSHTVTGLTNGSKYHIRVTPCNRQSACLHWSERMGFSHASVSGRPQASPPPPPVNKPGRIQDLTLTPGDHKLGVRWRAPSSNGGPDITRYQVRYKPAAATSWTSNPEVTSGTATTVPILTGDERMPLTNGALHHVQVRACNGSSNNDCGSWTQGEGTPDGRPQSLDVVPLPGREPYDRGNSATRTAVLTWEPVFDADAYVVQARVFKQNTWSAANCVGDLVGSPGRVTEPRCVIDLELITNVGGSAAGLQVYKAYELRVRSEAGGEASEFSSRVVIIDTPIESASGRSPTTGGQASLTWTTVDQILSDSKYEMGTYEFRYREIVSNADPDAEIHHSHLAWEPNAYIPVETTTDNPYTELTLYSIYGIQLIHTPRRQSNQPENPRVYAARDVYVWPSNEAAGTGDRAGKRVASFPLNYPLANSTKVPESTYEYRVCTETFFVLDPSLGAVSWTEFIKSAFHQWWDATDDIVRPLHNTTPCQNYAPEVQQLAQAVKSELGSEIQLDDATIQAHVEGVVERLRFSPVLRDALYRAAVERNQENVVSEVFMFEHEDMTAVLEMSGDVWSNKCGPAMACANRRGDQPHPVRGWITDIALRRERGYEVWINKSDKSEGTIYIPEVPAVGLNMCSTFLEDNNERNFQIRYGTLVHEVGHALGVRSADDVDDPDDQARHHPNSWVRDSTLRLGGSYCSPTPFDVLAMYALYQHVQQPMTGS